MEQSPYELRSIVEFLNNQMQRSEVLIVEAKQYQYEDKRVLVPSLFGYTEDARRIKERRVTVTSGTRRQWDKSTFLEEIRNKLSQHEIDAIEKLMAYIESRGFDYRLGTGKVRGSVSPVMKSISQKSLFSIYTDGKLNLNFAWLDDTDKAIRVRDIYFKLSKERLSFGTPIEDITKYPSLPIDQWGPQVRKVIDVFEELLAVVG